jgi:hypothetical protein
VSESPLACHIRRAVPPLTSPLFLFPVTRTRRSRRPRVYTATMSRATVYPALSAGEDLAAFSLEPLSSSRQLAAVAGPHYRCSHRRRHCRTHALDALVGHLALGRVAMGRMHPCASQPRQSCVAGPPLDSTRGLCFIFLFSKYNQINANSKFCTIFI